MLCLSVRQPFAEWLASGHKRIEWRSRPWHAMSREAAPGLRIAIHASSRFERNVDRDAERDAESFAARGRSLGAWPAVEPDAVACSAIVCTVELVACELHSPLGAPMWRWHVTAPRRVVPVIGPLKGKLGLWTLPGDVERQIMDREWRK